jgi:hypothetical protein
MPLQATSGAASYDGFGGGVVAEPNYIESCFSTYLYTGTAAALTITNNIDLSTKGGLVWLKPRASNASGNSHQLFDTSRGVQKYLQTNATAAQATASSGRSLTAFNTTGFSLGLDYNGENTSGITYASWTFRKQPKFFDVVTWTGNGDTSRTLTHSLGSVPGCIIVKNTSNTSDWCVSHRSLSSSDSFVKLNTTVAESTGFSPFPNTAQGGLPTSTQFIVRNPTINPMNTSGHTYVAYIFAHDAGGFGLTGTDNVISCGSFNTGAGDDVTVSLGYEPQWVMVKATNAAYSWEMYDNMRGMGNTFLSNLDPNLTQADNYQSTSTGCVPNATGFRSSAYWGANTNLIYIAIRRGPMKVPTTGTSVFSPIAVNAMQGTQQTTNFPVDMQLIANRGGETRNFSAVDRLRGVSTNTTSKYLGSITSSTAAESTSVVFATQNWNSTGFQVSANTAETTALFHSFKRAPSFMDVVCYTGTGANRTVNHNLGAVPQLMIVKMRSAVENWIVYSTTTGNTKISFLNVTNAPITDIAFWNNTTPTASVFTVGTDTAVNGSGTTYVAYLFATCAGVSKVGSYTGTATTKQIDCGFTAGARFVLIRRTDSTGAWYVWDTARGIIAGNDPYLLLNSTAAEVTSTDYIDTYSAGFELSSTAPAAINASGGTFIFFAVA